MIKYADFFVRGLAKLTDIAIFALPFVILLGWGDLVGLGRSYGTSLAILFSASYLFYQVAMHALFGQTFGKMWWRIKVLRADGGPLGWRRSLIRASVEIALYGLAALEHLFPSRHLAWFYTSYQGLANLWFTAAFFLIAWRSDCRAPHDLMAGCVVVHRVSIKSRAKRRKLFIKFKRGAVKFP